MRFEISPHNIKIRKCVGNLKRNKCKKKQNICMKTKAFSLNFILFTELLIKKQRRVLRTNSKSDQSSHFQVEWCLTCCEFKFECHKKFRK